MALADYLIAYLGNLASDLGWSTSSLSTVVSDTLETYGVDTEAQATDTKKLHAISKVHLWKKALIETSSKYNFSADGASFSRSQFYDMVLKNYELALSEAMNYLPFYQIEIGELFTENDPYTFIPWNERTS